MKPKIVSKSVWEEFGFGKNPYFATPLEANADHYELFARRDDESARFLSMMDTADGAFVVVSGDIGIGKTSFVNAQQHLLATGLAGWGPRLIPCVRPATLQSDEKGEALARRIVHHAVQDIIAYCDGAGVSAPKEVANVRDWLTFQSAPTRAGYQFTVGPFGFGASTQLPPVAEATISTWRDILEALASAVCEHLDVQGFVIFLDNAETLPPPALARTLMDFRDHFLAVKGIWWVLIGQSELYRNIDWLDRRVSQRMSGGGVELSHLDVDAFHDAIRRRVQSYRNRTDVDSPLSHSIHDLLFQAACGEVRFVFHVGNMLVQNVVNEVRTRVNRNIGAIAGPAVLQRALTEALQSVLIDKQIPDELAREVLATIAADAMKNVPAQDLACLNAIGKEWIQKEDYSRFGYATEIDFAEQFLERLRTQGLLGREGGTGDYRYRLKGFAWLRHIGPAFGA